MCQLHLIKVFDIFKFFKNFFNNYKFGIKDRLGPGSNIVLNVFDARSLVFANK